VVEHACHENAKRLRDQKNHKQEQPDLEPPIRGHQLELLCLKQRIEQVSAQKKTDHKQCRIAEGHNVASISIVRSRERIKRSAGKNPPSQSEKLHPASAAPFASFGFAGLRT
jgi:hypothetical protein